MRPPPTSTLLLASPALASIEVAASAHAQPVAFLNRTMVPLLVEGDACGYASHENESICGYGLCCSLKTNACSSDELSCSAINCLPKFSTGCKLQGSINEQLQPQGQPAGQNSSSLQKRQSTDAEDADASSSSSDLFKRPSISWLADLPRPELGSVPYGELITTCNEPGTVALTFDDGPWQYTQDLLDILRDYEAEATFFVCGGNMGGDGQITEHGHPELLRRMVSEGHQVGTHTWAHSDLTTIDDYDIIDQLLFNEQALVQALGRIPTYFRPPYFSTNDDVLDTVGSLGYHVINAGVDTNDWKGDYDAARQAFSQAIQQGQWDAGKIVLAHDIHDRTVHELAAYMIEQARDAGFRLVTVGECMGDPEQNWYRNPGTGGPYSPASSRPVKRDAVTPLGGQHEEPAGWPRSYYPPLPTGRLHKVPLEFGHGSPLVPVPAPTHEYNTLTTRAAEPSDRVDTAMARRGLQQHDAPPQPRPIVFALGPRPAPVSGGGSPSSKATFGLVLALVTVFFLFH